MNPVIQKTIERRQSPRIAFNVPLKLSQAEGEDFVTQTVNISRSGAYCEVDNYIEPMTKLKVNLLVPVRKGEKSSAKKVSCNGIVVRTEPIELQQQYNVAIFFSDITKKDSEIISDYINNLLEQEA